MTLIFYTSGNDNISDYSDLGYLSVKFDENLLYDVDHCYSKRRFDFEQFPVTPPTKPSKIWTISKSFTDLTIDCNGVRVFEINFASHPRSECAEKWSQDVAKIAFWDSGSYDDDTASDGYRFIPEPINSEFLGKFGHN